MADDKPQRKAVAEKPPIDWLSKPYTSYLSHAEKRRDLFAALSAVVSAHGSWIVSPPGERHVRIETPQGSALIIRLAEGGHKVRHVTTGTRNTAAGIVPTDIFELTLPR
jgi:hypothetical protein